MSVIKSYCYVDESGQDTQGKADDRLKGHLRYGVFRRTKDYDAATIAAIASAIKWGKPKAVFTTLIYVDGLTKAKRHEYGTRLRKSGLPVKQIRGIARDETNALMRLADALAGFVRDALIEQREDIKTLFQRARREGVLVEIEP